MSGYAQGQVAQTERPPASGRVILDLGRSCDVAELMVNGVALGARGWSPFAFDVTDAVREGADDLEITVRPSQAAILPNGSRYPAGLLGPANVRSEPLIVLELAS